MILRRRGFRKLIQRDEPINEEKVYYLPYPVLLSALAAAGRTPVFGTAISRIAPKCAFSRSACGERCRRRACAGELGFVAGCAAIRAAGCVLSAESRSRRCPCRAGESTILPSARALPKFAAPYCQAPKLSAPLAACKAGLARVGAMKVHESRQSGLRGSECKRDRAWCNHHFVKN